MKITFLTRVASAVKAYRHAGPEKIHAEPVEPTLTPLMATQLAPVELPEAKKGQTSLPGWKREPARTTDVIRKSSRATINTDATTFRTGSDKAEIIRNFLAVNPDMSATVSAYLRTGIPKEFTLVGYDMDGRVNPEATKLAHEILTRITYIGDATLGYNPTTDLQSLSESLGRELLLDGGMALELVLDDLLQPLFPAAIAVSRLSFKEDSTRGVYPVQVVAGEEIDLDLPTIFYISVDQDLLTVYADAYLNTAVRAVLTDEGFSNFLQRQLKRNIAPRMIATVIEEEIKKGVDVTIRNDAELFKGYMEGLFANIQQTLEELEPEDAIVTGSMVTYQMQAPGGTGAGVGNLLTQVHSILESRLTASLKSMPAILGRDDSSGSATTSTMLFLKNAAVVPNKLNVLYSRMFTQAVRLMSMDCYVEFKYAELDLRPKGEQEAYRAMEQSRLMEQWSVGLLTDEVASIMLTGRLPPEGFKPLSGTMFYKPNASAPANTTSQTSLMNGQKDNLKPDTPANKKGS